MSVVSTSNMFSLYRDLFPENISYQDKLTIKEQKLYGIDEQC